MICTQPFDTPYVIRYYFIWFSWGPDKSSSKIYDIIQKVIPAYVLCEDCFDKRIKNKNPNASWVKLYFGFFFIGASAAKNWEKLRSYEYVYL